MELGNSVMWTCPFCKARYGKIQQVCLICNRKNLPPATIIMLKGLPGCGKSTLANLYVKRGFHEINRDNLRKLCPGYVRGKFNSKIEKDVLAYRNGMAETNLKIGKSIISSDTNLGQKHLDYWTQLSEKYNAKLEVIDFTDPNSKYYVSLEECFKRDLQRDESVGKDVILKFWYEQNVPKNINLPKPPNHLRKAIIIDLDGTLCHSNGRGPFDEEYDHDLKDPYVESIINNFLHSYRIIIVSSREGTKKGRKLTIKWLKTNSIHYDELFMRQEKDKRGDDIVKKEIYETFIKDKYDVFFVVDDRPRVVRAWHSLGLKVFNVGFGYEF
jgi:predicted kinase